MKTLKQEFKEERDENLKLASHLASELLQQIALTSNNLKHLNEKGQEALDILTQRHQPEFEEFGIVQLDTYKYQTILPTKLKVWSRNFDSLKEAYDYIHEKIGRVKIIIRMLEN